MTEALLKDFEYEISSYRLIPSSGGRFEVSINGELVFSKLETDRFPQEEEIKEKIKAIL